MKQKEKAMKNQEILFTSPGIAELQEYSVPVAASAVAWAREYMRTHLKCERLYVGDLDKKILQKMILFCSIFWLITLILIQNFKGYRFYLSLDLSC
jgi:hypothetical protein